MATVEQPTEWISYTTTVWKPEKKSVHVCLDPRDINKVIRQNHFHLPTLDDVLPRLKGARVFSLLDAKDGFLQVKLSESSTSGGCCPELQLNHPRERSGKNMMFFGLKIRRWRVPRSESLSLLATREWRPLKKQHCRIRNNVD